MVQTCAFGRTQTFTTGNEIVLVIIPNRGKAKMGDRAGMPMAGQRDCLGRVCSSSYDWYQPQVLPFYQPQSDLSSSTCNNEVKENTKDPPEDMLESQNANRAAERNDGSTRPDQRMSSDGVKFRNNGFQIETVDTIFAGNPM